MGERLITSRSEPVFGGVYKLAAIMDRNGRPSRKPELGGPLFRGAARNGRARLVPLDEPQPQNGADAAPVRAARADGAIAYAPAGEKDKPEFLDLVNQFLVCMFAESDNMIFRVLLRSSRELAHVTYYIVAYTLDMRELCTTYRTVLDG